MGSEHFVTVDFRVEQLPPINWRATKWKAQISRGETFRQEIKSNSNHLSFCGTTLFTGRS